MGIIIGKKEEFIAILISVICSCYKATEYIGYLNENNRLEARYRSYKERKEKLQSEFARQHPSIKPTN